MKSVVFLLVCFCGTILAHPGNVRIIGGDDARAAQFPSAVSVAVHTSDNVQHFCGGTLIDNQWVLTAAQCIYKATVSVIQLGSNHLTNPDPARVTVSSSHFVPHPDFNNITFEHDIGLIKLRQPIEFTDYIKPAALAFAPLPSFARALIVGWGTVSDDDSTLSNSLQYATVTTLTNDECKLVYGNQITENMLCLEGNFNEGTCIGDMGGPLYLLLIGGTQLYHVGIASFISGNGCESTDPSGFTRTWPYIDWIKNETGMA